jgi:orotate phosphoribosyltransferase|tara:strand:+ start:20 stop:550 length:531 start_codon:yes stop_codon:yes gene_type:complete
MNKAELGKAIYDISNIKGEFVLRSGIKANEYFDKYLFESDPVILTAIAEHMSQNLPPRFDKLAGLEMGGIPIATAISLRTGRATLFVRKEAKTHGTCKIAEGGDFEGEEVVIIEDVVTSGGAVVNAVNELLTRGAVVHHVCCAIEREGDGRVNLEEMALTLTPLFTQAELEMYAGV